uniref:C-C motif chemokine n=1 Tax=Cyprinus carpio TaxID=7962 RepID=A0A8C1GLG7_CYPCA
MRQYCLCLFIGLLAVAFLQSSVMCNHFNLSSECCFNYYGRKIPIAKIDSYMKTRVDCNKTGVVFVTMKGYRICVDPELNWVKRVMRALDDRDLLHLKQNSKEILSLSFTRHNASHDNNEKNDRALQEEDYWANTLCL